MHIQQVEVVTRVSIADRPNSDKDSSVQIDSWLRKVGETQDKVAFAELFKWFAPKIKMYGLKRFNDQSLAMDLVQETMTLVWRKATLFNRSKGNASGWIFTIMRNHSFDMLRKIQTNKEDTISEDLWPLYDKQIETNSVDFLENKNLEKALLQLPLPQRIVIEGLYVQGLTQQELSEQLAEPIGTIKSRLRLALTKLRQEYEHE